MTVHSTGPFATKWWSIFLSSRRSGSSPTSTRSNPASTHARCPIAETVLEQHAGGDVYDRGVDGTVCRWGRVLTFDPPHTIAFSWDIGPDWQVTSDLARASEVEITFAGEDDHRTRVTLVHRHIDRHVGLGIPPGRA